jgi:hypothetical protein
MAHQFDALVLPDGDQVKTCAGDPSKCDSEERRNEKFRHQKSRRQKRCGKKKFAKSRKEIA